MHASTKPIIRSLPVVLDSVLARDFLKIPVLGARIGLTETPFLVVVLPSKIRGEVSVTVDGEVASPGGDAASVVGFSDDNFATKRC